MEKLFTYGTIRNPRVQKRLLGKTINGTPDSIKGYCKSKISIEGEQYPVLKPKPKSSVRGSVLEVSKKELSKHAYAFHKISDAGQSKFGAFTTIWL